MSAPTSTRQANAPQDEHSESNKSGQNGFSAAAVRSQTNAAAAVSLARPRELPTFSSNNAQALSTRATLLRRVENFARERLMSLPPTYSYHCLEHTEQVVNNSKVIAEAEGLNDELHDLLFVSAWMHDVGIIETYSGHEIVSCRMMREIIGSELTGDELDLVEEAIMATEIPQKGAHKVSQILCDADLLYLGTSAFIPWSERLRQEHSILFNRSYTDSEWAEINIKFIRHHTYFTQFAREYCDAGCAFNLQALEQV